MVKKHYSAKTSIKQIPAGFNIVKNHFGWKPYSKNFDVGGGKYDLMSEALAKEKVRNYIYDPYNRDSIHNRLIWKYIEEQKADTATLFNVLNVIKDEMFQLQAIMLAFQGLKDNGVCYIRSMYKNPSGKSGFTKSGTFQHCMTHKQYAEIVKKVFPIVELKHGLIIAKKK